MKTKLRMNSLAVSSECDLGSSHGRLPATSLWLVRFVTVWVSRRPESAGEGGNSGQGKSDVLRVALI